MRRLLPLFVAAALLGPAWASNPGEPLDCSDWVFLDPGLSCTPWLTRPCDNGTNTFCSGRGLPLTFDNEGREYAIRELLSVRVESCGGIDRLELVRYDGNSPQEVVAYFETRCSSSTSSDAFSNGYAEGIVFDAANGRFLVPMQSYCFGSAPGCPPGYGTGRWVAALQGFATTFDVLQSFTPSTTNLGFRVPYMPEGIAAVDWFDTYWGNLSEVGDWSKTKGLQCGYPAAPPQTGDYLTVADTLPMPAVGQGYYYLTAATYQGQTRYGRKASGGQLSGRDPAVLPGCNPE